MMNVDSQSPSKIIRDGWLERLKAVPLFKSVKLFSPNPMDGPIQPENLPYIGCYFLEENIAQDGDGNHTAPHFLHTTRIGLSIQIACQDKAVAESNLDTAYWTIMRMLENPTWHTFPIEGEWNGLDRLGRPRPVQVEAVTRGMRRLNFGPKGQEQETKWAECSADFTFTWRSIFPPAPFDDLDLIHVTVAYPWPYDPNEQEPFAAVYDFLSEDFLPDEPIDPPYWPPISNSE